MPSRPPTNRAKSPLSRRRPIPQHLQPILRLLLHHNRTIPLPRTRPTRPRTRPRCPNALPRRRTDRAQPLIHIIRHAQHAVCQRRRARRPTHRQHLRDLAHALRHGAAAGGIAQRRRRHADAAQDAELVGPAAQQVALRARPRAEAVEGVVFAGAGADGLVRIAPAQDEPPLPAVQAPLGLHVAARSGAAPEDRVLDCELVEEVLVDAARVRRLARLVEVVFEHVPGDQDEEHEWDGGDEIPFQGRVPVAVEGADVHAEEADDEGEREEDEGDPAEAPHAHAELQRVARVADADGLVH